MTKQHWLLCLLHYTILVGLNVPQSTALTASKEQNLDLSTNLKAKREVTQIGDNLRSYTLDDVQKRAPKLFLGMRGKKIPSGFMGVRGRRLDSMYYPHNSMVLDNSMTSNVEDGISDEFRAEKRDKFPFGFMGVRGIKLPSGFVRARGRRIPVAAFLGMRGKKSEIYEEAENMPPGFKEEDKRTPQGFLGMRGKKSSMESDDILAEHLGFGTASNFGVHNEMDQDPLPKRAPMSFLGMRG